MTRRNLILIILLFTTTFSFAQDCNCKTTYEWVKETFEKNDAGFQYIIDKKGEASYTIHNDLYSKKVKRIKNPNDCETVIREWLSFFRKSHIEFHYIAKTNNNIEPVKTTQNDSETKISDNVNYQLNPLYERFLKSQKPFIERLNSRTLYLRIPSFNGNEKPLIDSLIAKNINEIGNVENLIIDIRNGTGGNDDSYQNIMPFIYTNPIRMPSVEFLSTPLNNQRMYEMATNTGLALEIGLNPTKEQMADFQAKFGILNNHIGEFVNLNSEKVRITKEDTIYKYPKQIGIIINQNNVSTDEQFILEAKQSKKVKLFGRTTKGGLDVSNLNVTFSENKEFVLVYALSRSLRIPNMVVDDIGIMPDYFLDNEIHEKDWIDYVSKILNE